MSDEKLDLVVNLISSTNARLDKMQEAIIKLVEVDAKHAAQLEEITRIANQIDRQDERLDAHDTVLQGHEARIASGEATKAAVVKGLWFVVAPILAALGIGILALIAENL